jgi:hypothetical protein
MAAFRNHTDCSRHCILASLTIAVAHLDRQTEEPTMLALIDLWLTPARLCLDLVAPLRLAPVTTDWVPLAKARYIRRKRKVLRSRRGD